MTLLRRRLRRRAISCHANRGNYALSLQTNALFNEAGPLGAGLSDGSANITGNADQSDCGCGTDNSMPTLP